MNLIKQYGKFGLFAVAVIMAAIAVVYFGQLKDAPEPQSAAIPEISEITEIDVETAPELRVENVDEVSDPVITAEVEPPIVDPVVPAEVDPVQTNSDDAAPVIVAPNDVIAPLNMPTQPEPDTQITADAPTLLDPESQSDNSVSLPQDDVQITSETAPDVVPLPDTPELVVESDTPATLAAAPDAPQIFSATTLTLQSIQAPDAVPSPDALAPRFDIVRVDPNGATLVAGQAEPGSIINIISDGEVLVETTANASGEFVAFLTAPAAQPQPVEISSEIKQTEGVVSQSQVIILPAQADVESSAPLVVLASPDKVEVIQPFGLSATNNVSLDSISYDSDGNVMLAGRGAPGLMARVYADDELQGGATIGDAGSWDVSLTGLAAGRYILRVDEIKQDGSVSSRVESPFQREFPEALALAQFTQGAKVIVQPGNTLWLMATQAYGDGESYTQIFSANEDAIRDPDLIYPGQVFSIPSVSE